MFFGDTADFQFQQFALGRDKLGTKKLPEEFYGSFFLRVPGICPRKGQIRN